ncbi:hypothetical protein [Thermococcus sp. JCM 11816]|uniref:hypothetical protein n=1 Tax=Thermococcus sp. (strain JCM 11816 / KS-1) TaxID=1295125 RepID=UPI000AE55B14
MPLKKLKPVDPIKLYSAIRDLRMPFMLRSAEKDSRKARFTYISAEPEFVVEVGEGGTEIDGGERVSDERNPPQSS